MLINYLENFINEENLQYRPSLEYFYKHYKKHFIFDCKLNFFLFQLMS